MSRLERELIVRALEQTQGNVTHAARLLKISRKGLQLKMKELNLRERDPETEPRRSLRSSPALCGCCGVSRRCGSHGTSRRPTRVARTRRRGTSPRPSPSPRPGMVWIPPGVLIVGHAARRLPRVADEEMPGEQVVMRGFYIDTSIRTPNEVGAIPHDQRDARRGARALRRRSRSASAPSSSSSAPARARRTTIYEYGDAYKAAAAARTGSTRSLVPNGVNAGCQSAFGVHDLHGGVWSWTSSDLGRAAAPSPDLVTIRGGNGVQGELIGRCANGRGAEARRDAPRGRAFAAARARRTASRSCSR